MNTGSSVRKTMITPWRGPASLNGKNVFILVPFLHLPLPYSTRCGFVSALTTDCLETWELYRYPQQMHGASYGFRDFLLQKQYCVECTTVEKRVL